MVQLVITTFQVTKQVPVSYTHLDVYKRQVYTVTSLKDDGSEGTLRWAIEKSGKRTIVFAVGGVIPLSKQLQIKNDEDVYKRQISIAVTGRNNTFEPASSSSEQLVISPEKQLNRHPTVINFNKFIAFYFNINTDFTS